MAAVGAQPRGQLPFEDVLILTSLFMLMLTDNIYLYQVVYIIIMGELCTSPQTRICACVRLHDHVWISPTCVCSAALTGCRFIWFNEILTKRLEAPFAFQRGAGGPRIKAVFEQNSSFPSIPSLTVAYPLQMLNERQVMVRVGGGWETLATYLQKHDPCRGGGPAGRADACRDKVRPPARNFSPDSYMVVGAHYRGKK